MSENIPKSINLVDFSHMLTVNFKARANDSGPNDAGQATLNQLAGVRTTAEHTIVCLDSGPYWRRSVFPDYKKGREREPEYAAIFEWTLERVRKDGYNVAAAPGEEADDVMATLAAVFANGPYNCRDIRLVTQDKDACQCINESVRMFAPILGKSGEFDIRDADWVKKKFGNVDWAAEEQEGLWPKDIALALAIMGDTSDKIPGIKGIGIKGAAKLINTYKTIEGMATACVGAVDAAKMTGKPPAAFWRNYAAGMAELPKWLKLTTLNTEAALELHPLKYLEKLPMQKLVEESRGVSYGTPEVGDADDSDLMPPEEVDWEAVERETAERERQEMAAALPVAEKPKPIIGADPNAAPILQQAAEERRVNRHGVVTPDPSIMDAPPKAPAAPTTRSAAAADSGKAASTAPAPQTAPFPAGAAQAPSAASGPAHVSAVVPPTQGPPKPRESAEGSLARVPPPNWSLAAQPQSPSQMMWVAERLINARAAQAFGTPEAVFNAISLGRELGLGYATSLDAFHLYNNKPLLKAVTYKALAEQHPDCEWIIITHADEHSATIKTKHRRIPEILEYTYTRERAQKAGHFTGGNKENWNNKTQEMLEARATTKAIRRWYAGVIIGRRSLEEEQDDD